MANFTFLTSEQPGELGTTGGSDSIPRFRSTILKLVPHSIRARRRAAPLIGKEDSSIRVSVPHYEPSLRRRKRP
jgi:hypothetical protein